VIWPKPQTLVPVADYLLGRFEELYISESCLVAVPKTQQIFPSKFVPFARIRSADGSFDEVYGPDIQYGMGILVWVKRYGKCKTKQNMGLKREKSSKIVERRYNFGDECVRRRYEINVRERATLNVVPRCFRRSSRLVVETFNLYSYIAGCGEAIKYLTFVGMVDPYIEIQ